MTRSDWELLELPEMLRPLRPLFGSLLREEPSYCPKCRVAADQVAKDCVKCNAELPPPKLYFEKETSYGLVFLGCVILAILYVVYWGLSHSGGE